jgi:hypothetical protein
LELFEPCAKAQETAVASWPRASSGRSLDLTFALRSQQSLCLIFALTRAIKEFTAVAIQVFPRLAAVLFNANQ